MADRELLELAAKAAGLQIVGDVDRMIVQPGHLAGGFVFRNEYGGDSLWNPLTDDGDALRLAVKLHMLIDVEPGPIEKTTAILQRDQHSVSLKEHHDGDRLAATRRAIVRAAAEIGKAL